MITENPAAFPLYEPETAVTRAFVAQGMTLRDYFAAKAMQGLLSNPVAFELQNDPSEFARVAYVQADEMLKERGQA